MLFFYRRTVCFAAFALANLVTFPHFSHAQGIQPRTLVSRGKKSLKTPKHEQPKSIQLTVGTNVSLPTYCMDTVIASAPKATKANPSPTPACVSNKASSCTWVAQSWPFAGVALKRDTGCLIGMPTEGRDATVIIVVSDSKSGKVFHELLDLKISPADPTVESSSLPTHTVNEPILEHLNAFGGTGSSYTWKLASGSNPPAGLSIDSQGNITGTSTKAGAASFTVIATDSTPKESAPGTITMLIDAAPGCSNPKYNSNYFRGFFPLSLHKNINPQGDPINSFPTQNDVVCFYNTSGQLAPLGQVQYLYGVGQGTNTISADMVSIQFPSPVGMQFSIGTSVTGGGSTNATTLSNTSTTQSTPTTPAAALATIEAGGNFYLHALYPLYVYNNNSMTFLAAINGKVGFGFDGFAGQATLSQATEQYVSVPAELFFNYNAIGDAGGVYADYRGGVQTVPGSFKTAAGLPSNVFGLQQFSFGLNFAGLMRIGAQRYIGPSAAFSAPSSADFNKWHFVIQLSPKLSGS